MAGLPQNSYTNITSAVSGGLQIATGATTLERVIVNTTSAYTFGIADATSGTTAGVAILKANVVEGTYYYNARLGKGLRIVTGSAKGTNGSNVTVVWRQ